MGAADNGPVLIHPFQDRGLGQAPFRLIGMESKVGPLTVTSKDGVSYQVGSPGQPMGTCDFCGIGIANCYIIRSADGKEFIVGSDCVAKTGDAKLISKAKFAERERQKAIREAKRVAEAQERRKVYEAALQAQRERNGGKTDAEVEEERKKAENAMKGEASRWLWSVLVDSGSNFGLSVGHELRMGIRTLPDLSPRCLEICKDIYAKSFGHKRSDAYAKAAGDFEAKLMPPDEYEPDFDKLYEQHLDEKASREVDPREEGQF